MTHWKKYSPVWRRGITLIEVLAGTVLLSLLVVALVAGNAAHIRQAERAEDQRVAVDALEQLLAKWNLEGWPTTSSGVVNTKYLWQSRVERVERLGKAQGAVVRVELYKNSSDPGLAKATQPVVHVDVIRSLPTARSQGRKD